MLSKTHSLIWAIGMIVAFHVAYVYEVAAPLIALYLAGWFALAWVPTARWAFYLGFGIGLATGGPQLRFMADIFGPAAIGLWSIFALLFALFLLAAHSAVTRWPRWGWLAIPFLWTGFEYFRSEVWWLRFSWLTPGYSLTHPYWIAWTGWGMYGFSLLVLLSLGMLRFAGGVMPRVAGASLLLLPLLGPLQRTFWSGEDPFVVGIQWEGASDEQLLQSLRDAKRNYPDLDIAVLSEYAFDGPVPDSIRAWCYENHRHLIAGGKDRRGAESNDYLNTVFVVDPDGEVVFQQAKCVPVQFMRDGLPAESQQVWDSPWGSIGIAICYDLSYARVMDNLVHQGAQALIVPTMDNEEWGPQERWLHTKIAPVRAREYNVPIFRLASSGISQLVLADGRVAEVAPAPGQGAMLAGRLPMRSPGHLPVDRYVLPGITIMAGLLIVALSGATLRERIGFRMETGTSNSRGESPQREPGG